MKGPGWQRARGSRNQGGREGQRNQEGSRTVFASGARGAGICSSGKQHQVRLLQGCVKTLNPSLGRKSGNDIPTDWAAKAVSLQMLEGDWKEMQLDA